MAGLVSIVLDCHRAAPLARFWAVALGWPVRPYDEEEVARLAALGHTPDDDPTVALDAPDGTLTMFCVEVPKPKSVKNRMHLDIEVRDRTHFEELKSLGARIVRVHEQWVVMTDPEGNEFCVIGAERAWLA
jgi:hypothetical protein